MNDYYQGKVCLVTGGDGFIGSHLCRRLSGVGATVIKYDSRFQSTLCVGDFNHLIRVMGQPWPNRVDLVFHLAAKTEVRSSHTDPRETWATNTLGTLNVLEACRVLKVPLVVASTDKVYGDQGLRGDRWTVETDPLLANADVYSASKKTADELCQLYARNYGMAIRIARPVNTYGPGQRNETTLITNTCCRLARGEKPVVHGDGQTMREWMYIDDAVGAYLLLGRDVVNDPVDGIVYNIGTGRRETALGVVYMILSRFGRPLSDYECQGDPTPQITHQGLSSTRFRTKFPEWSDGLTPLATGLHRTIQWYKDIHGVS